MENDGGVPCAGNPDLWFPSTGRVGLPMYVCQRRCPYVTSCSVVGLDEEIGIWGGTTPEMRGFGDESQIVHQLAEAEAVRLIADEHAGLWKARRQSGISPERAIALGAHIAEHAPEFLTVGSPLLVTTVNAA